MNRRDMVKLALGATVAAQSGRLMAAASPSAGQTVVRRSGRFNGRAVGYEVAAETTLVRPVTGKSATAIFSISYFAGAGARRPVVFAFNGGPGSSAAAVHLSGIAPKRIRFAGPIVNGDLLATFELVDSEWSILDRADLVFIDPPGTGFSTPSGQNDYWSASADSHAICDFIRQWLGTHRRWGAPVYILGESYGTYRAALVVRDLMGGLSTGEMTGIPVAGAILIGSIVNRTQTVPAASNDVAFQLYVPTMAMIAQAHGCASTGMTAAQLKEEMDRFVTQRYGPALFLGNRLPAGERAALITYLAKKTGLPPEIIDRANLRPTPQLFAKTLLEKRGLVVGSYDGRVTSAAPYQADPIGGNPAMTQINSAYAIGFNRYLEELGIGGQGPYRYINFVANKDWKWDEDSDGYSDVSPLLANAMITNRAMHILSQSGLYDLATPYTAAEHSFTQPMFPADRTTIRTYAAGHMCYVGDEPARAFCADIAALLG